MISPMPLIPTRSRSRRKIAKPTLGGCVLLSRRTRPLKRKRSRQRSLSFGPMTQQPATRMLICDCCSALQVMQPKQRSAKLRCLSRKEPRNWQARATLGLACLRLGRNQEALAAIREPRVTGVEPPGALAVRAAILAANGYEEAPATTRASSAPNRFCPKNALSSLRCCNSRSVRRLSGEDVTRCLSKSQCTDTAHYTGSTLQPYASSLAIAIDVQRRLSGTLRKATDTEISIVAL